MANVTGDYSLTEFENWCRGEGRGGPASGVHWNALERARSFREFKDNEKRRKAFEQQRAARKMTDL